jgi:hypothetical protein
VATQWVFFANQLHASKTTALLIESRLLLTQALSFDVPLCLLGFNTRLFWGLVCEDFCDAHVKSAQECNDDIACAKQGVQYFHGKNSVFCIHYSYYFSTTCPNGGKKFFITIFIARVYEMLTFSHI